MLTFSYLDISIKKKKTECKLILYLHCLPSLCKPILVGNQKVPNCAECFAIFLLIKHCSLFLKRKRNQEKNVQKWCCLHGVHITANFNETQLQGCQATRNCDITEAKL